VVLEEFLILNVDWKRKQNIQQLKLQQERSLKVSVDLQ